MSCQARILLAHDIEVDELLDKLQANAGKGTAVLYVELNELQVEKLACAGILWGAMKHHPAVAIAEALKQIIRKPVAVADRVIFPGQRVELSGDQKMYQRTFHIFCDKKDVFHVKRILRKL